MEARTVQLNVDAAKPGRWLFTMNLREVAAMLECEPADLYMYINNMDPEKVAGNHAHARKRELILCVDGQVLIGLRHMKTGENVLVELAAEPNSVSHRALLIPTGIAHAVKNTRRDGMSRVLVFASAPPRDGDDIDCEIF